MEDTRDPARDTEPYIPCAERPVPVWHVATSRTQYTKAWEELTEGEKAEIRAQVEAEGDVWDRHLETAATMAFWQKERAK